MNRPKNTHSAQNKGCVTANPSPSSSLGHRSLAGTLFDFFNGLFVVCWVQEAAFNYAHHTYGSSPAPGARNEGKELL